MMKRRSARDNALNSPTLLLLGSCLQAAFPRKTGLWGGVICLGAVEGGKNNRDDVVSGVSPVVQAWRLHFRTFVLWEHATDATNSGVLRALLLSPALFFDSA